MGIRIYNEIRFIRQVDNLKYKVTIINFKKIHYTKNEIIIEKEKVIYKFNKSEITIEEINIYKEII